MCMLSRLLVCVVDEEEIILCVIIRANVCGRGHKKYHGSSVRDPIVTYEQCPNIDSELRYKV